jgi:hypothetical protein
LSNFQQITFDARLTLISAFPVFLPRNPTTKATNKVKAMKQTERTMTRRRSSSGHLKKERVKELKNTFSKFDFFPQQLKPILTIGSRNKFIS